MVCAFGRLHIEMAALKTTCDWLQGRDCVQALVQAEIAVTVESFLRVVHVARTRISHQITVAALHILQHRAYDCYCQREFVDSNESNLSDFEDGCQQRAMEIPQFQYWATFFDKHLIHTVHVP